MQRLRILIAGVESLLADILVDGMSRDPRLEIKRLRASCGWESLAAALGDEPDVLLLGDQIPAASYEIVRLLYDHPNLVVLTIGDGGRSATLHRLRLETNALTNIGVQELISSVFELCGRPSSP
jgi:hypothetical protein